MKIAQSFKDNIKATFYDKSIDTYTSSEVDDGAGFITRTLTEGDSIDGNVHFLSVQGGDIRGYEQIQQDYGLQDRQGMVVSTDAEVETGSFLKYDDRFYEVVGLIKQDSHNLLIAGHTESSELEISA